MYTNYTKSVAEILKGALKPPRSGRRSKLRRARSVKDILRWLGAGHTALTAEATLREPKILAGDFVVAAQERGGEVTAPLKVLTTRLNLTV